MKHGFKGVLTVMSLFVAAPSAADSWAVTAAAAMGGGGTMCGGGPCGLEISHNNMTTPAYVEDRSPNDETVYRAEFLFDAKTVSTTANYRQPLFNAIARNPDPTGTTGVCPTAQFVTAFRLFHQAYGGLGQISSLILWGTGNLCGERATTGIIINRNQEYRVCVEWTLGVTSGGGTIALAAVDSSSSCPSSGDSAYHIRALNNSHIKVDRVQLGTPQLNFFGVGETSTLYFDEFASYNSVFP